MIDFRKRYVFVDESLNMHYQNNEEVMADKCKCMVDGLFIYLSQNLFIKYPEDMAPSNLSPG